MLIIRIYLFGEYFADCCITTEEVILSEENVYKPLGIKPANDITVFDRTQEILCSKSLRLVTNAFYLKPFIKECLNSEIYRKNVQSHLNELSGSPRNGLVFLKLKLKPPEKEVIDYNWNERILRLIWSRIEIENAFSWLSTLGGAYSALGDYFDHCAEEAGRISVRQYKLSKMLGDDSLAARSELYSALAYAQKGRLKLSRHIVRDVVNFAYQTKDRRLVRMCQGVWAKLKYLRRMKNKISLEENSNGKII